MGVFFGVRKQLLMGLGRKDGCNKRKRMMTAPKKIFGRSDGENLESKQIWTDKWEKNGKIVHIQKSAKKFGETLKDEIEAWDEEIVEEEEDGSKTVKRKGKNFQENRIWKETWTSKGDSGTCKFEEKQGNVRRGRKTKGTKENNEEKSWLSDEETRQIKSKIFSEGHFSGKEKRLEKRSGNITYCKWYENKDGSRESDEWTESSSSLERWGEKRGVTMDGEEYSVKWKNRKDGDFEESSVIRRWDRDGRSWGEIENDLIDGTTKRNRIEKWSNNAEESTKNVIETRITKEDGEEKMLKNIHSSSTRHSDGMHWGENKWTLSRAEQEDSVIEEIGNDKWWKESHGNSWGEVKSQNFIQQIETEKHWYDNGAEKQVDAWTTEKGKGKNGYKEGNRAGNYWYEKWEEDEAGNRHTTKEWSEPSARWGEFSGNEGKRVWIEKWGDADIEGGKKSWRNIYDDDGQGTFSNKHYGNETVLGTVRWYCNEWGSVSEKQEQWAVKKGADEHGAWEEKWKELPWEKSALKIGHNNSGDKWHEEWYSKTKDGKEIEKKAKKIGSKAVEGTSWEEEWFEDSTKKWAKKTGSVGDKKGWKEEWGEYFDEQNGVKEKWADKSTHEDGRSWGKSWGTQWDKNGEEARKWGEEWCDGFSHKWNS
eukprot:GHVP01059528.1.p1 GENE.GHVP01059528.1~~GHVP01059528.1.p1  ORF type:complete len:660 (-),score=169.77 GHVP01059528.1:1186-3132(-)